MATRVSDRSIESTKNTDSKIIGWGEIVLGAVVILLAGFAAWISVIVIGLVLVIRGLLDSLQSLRSQGKRLTGRLATGLVSVVAGLLLFFQPGIGASILSLILAGLFIIEGFYKLVAPWMERWPNAGYVTLTGALSLALGLFILGQWPITSFLLLAALVGIELILNGLSLTLVGSAAKRFAFGGVRR